MIVDTNTNWIEKFQGLSSLSESLKVQLVEQSKIIRVEKNKQIFGPGKAPEHLLLLLDGIVRVQQVSEQGREIFLYRIVAGESCVLTSACLLAYEDYQAEGITETEIEGVSIPKYLFEKLLAESSEFRRFVLTAYSRRITDLFRIIDDVAFKRVDIRLASVLLRKQETEGRRLTSRQQDLASELGTAREVISRQLHEFKRKQWIDVGRGWIEILNSEGLRELAETK